MSLNFKSFLVSAALLVSVSCGKDEKKSQPEAPPAPGFETVSPILETNCTPCHAPGGRLSGYVGNEALVREKAAAIAERIQIPADQKGIMPPVKSGKKLSDEDKATLLKFLGQ